MPLSSVFGHDPAVRALRQALETDQLAGTYLFAGPESVGKTTLARAFAEAAACLSPSRFPFDACGKCESCRRAQAGQQPEIALIAPAGDLTQIWQFWDRDGRPPGILQHTLSYAPVIGRRRVYIIERADTLNEAAANSLLKVLEEPPPYALFVLLTPHTARMLPTVLSRSQVVRLIAAPRLELARFLEREYELPPHRAGPLAAYAEGRTGAAVSFARDPNAEREMDRVLDFAGTLVTTSPLGALQAGESMRKLASGLRTLAGDVGGSMPAAEDEAGESAPKERLSRTQLGLLMDLLAAYYRDLLALRLGGPAAPVVHEDHREALSIAAARAPAARWTAALDALLTARRRLDQNINVRLLTDWLAVRLVAYGG